MQFVIELIAISFEKYYTLVYSHSFGYGLYRKLFLLTAFVINLPDEQKNIYPRFLKLN